MPFDLRQAANRLRNLHADALAFRRALLDVAFAAGCPVSEEAVALEHGDAVTLRMASPGAEPGQPRLLVAVLDLDPLGPAGTWPAALDSLGGPVVAQTWLLALHGLLRQGRDAPWELVYTRGPALGVPGYVRERWAQPAETLQLVPCPTQPSDTGALDGVALTLRRAENLWRLPACDWTAALTAESPGALAHLRAWLRALPGPWTLHQLTLDATGALAAILRADRPLQPPAGMTLRELPDAPRLAFPVNDALLAWPQTWLPAPLAMRTLSDGLWLAGLTPPVPADAPLPEQVGGLTLEWQVEPVARSADQQLLLAVGKSEAAGPVAAGLDGPIWRLPGVSELAFAERALAPRFAGALKALRA